MALIKGIHHAALRCVSEDEMNRTASFYCNILGLKRVRNWGKGRHSACMIDTGSGLLELFADAEAGRRPGQVDHVALATDNIDACVAACREQGLTVMQDSGDVFIPSEEAFPVRFAFVIGVAGEIIEFFREL